ncbi:porin [Haliangium sp.]|uniref:porin n=1 Tax=Haliangium sp. TaxID=2663208 RepID=UPI003D0CC5FC
MRARALARARVAAGVLLALGWLGGLTPVSAQSDGRTPGQRIEALEQEFASLREQATVLPAMTAAAQDLEARLAVLETQLAELARRDTALPDALDTLDAVEARLAEVATEVASLRGRVADAERPGVSASGGSVEHSGGFRWSTADGQYRLQLSGYVQPRYELRAAAGEVDTSTLRLRRARLTVAGQSGEALTFKLVLSAPGSPPLLEYYGDYAVHEAVNVRFGQYKTHWTRAFLTSSTRLAFPELAAAIDDLRYDRDIQIGVHGQLLGQRLGYYLGVGNGAGKNRLDDNLDKAVTARLDAVILGQRFAYGYGDIARTERPALMLGAGVVRDAAPAPAQIGALAVVNDVDGDGTADDVARVSVSADAALRYRGLDLTVEAVWRWEDTEQLLRAPGNEMLLAAVGDRPTRRGVTVEASYLLPRDVLVGARASYGELSFLGAGDRSSRLPATDERVEIDALVQLYRGGRRFLGLTYTLRDDRGARAGAPEPDINHRLIAEAQILF